MDHLTVAMTKAEAKGSLQEAHDNLQVKSKEFQDQFEDIQAKISQKEQLQTKSEKLHEAYETL